MNHPAHPARASRRRGGFTLVEVIVAMTVLTIMAVLVAQLTGAAVRATNSGRERMDLDAQARVILDRLGTDFAKMLKRDDVGRVFPSAGSANDQITFYCELPGYPAVGGAAPAANPRSLSVVGYRVNADNRLERGSLQVDWGTNVHTAAGTAPPTIGDANYQVISDEAFRFKVAYLLRAIPGNAARSKPLLVKTPPASVADIQAVVVGLALLDGTQRMRLPSGTLPASLPTALPDTSDSTVAASTQDYAALWTSRVQDSAGFASTASVPQSVAAGARVYQRYYELR